MSKKNVDIELIKKDIETMQTHDDKVNSILEQLKELTGGITKMIAIHEEKHLQHLRDDERLQKLMETNDASRKKEVEDLEHKLDETKEQLHSRIGNMESKIMKAIHSSNSEQETRLKNLEIWKWKFAGAMSVFGVVFAFIINYRNILDFFSKQ